MRRLMHDFALSRCKSMSFLIESPSLLHRWATVCRSLFPKGWRTAILAPSSSFGPSPKALVPKPTVAANDDADNEFGRCVVRRENCFRGSTQDLCQVCLRCNVDYQYQNRTFPEEDMKKQEAIDDAPEHTTKKPQQKLPGILGWLLRRGSTAMEKRQRDCSRPSPSRLALPRWQIITQPSI